MNIVPTQAIHHDQVESLLDLCFGKNRKERTAYLLRQGTQPIESLSFVATENGDIIGSISCSPVTLNPISDDIDFAPLSLIMLGPIAISPKHQNIGIGRDMITQVIDAIQSSKDYYDMPMILIGDEEYYARFGFINHVQNEWQLPGPFDRNRLLVRSDKELPLIAALSARV